MKHFAGLKKSFASVLTMATWILVTFASISFSTNYYVDNIIGNDGNTGMGTTAALAWKTLTNPSSKTFAPGDSILFKAGGVWSGYLIVDQGRAIGTASNPIVFDMYGTGAKPVINGTTTSTEGAAVYIRLVTYVEFNNFEVTCPNGAMGVKFAPGAPATSGFLK